LELWPFENQKIHKSAFKKPQNFVNLGGGPALILKVKAFSLDLTSSMILRLSESARLI